MLKRSSRFQTQLAILADVLLVCLAMVPALALHKLLDHLRTPRRNRAVRHEEILVIRKIGQPS